MLIIAPSVKQFCDLLKLVRVESLESVRIRINRVDTDNHKLEFEINPVGYPYDYSVMVHCSTFSGGGITQQKKDKRGRSAAENTYKPSKNRKKTRDSRQSQLSFSSSNASDEARSSGRDEIHDEKCVNAVESVPQEKHPPDAIEANAPHENYSFHIEYLLDELQGRSYIAHKPMALFTREDDDMMHVQTLDGSTDLQVVKTPVTEGVNCYKQPKREDVEVFCCLPLPQTLSLLQLAKKKQCLGLQFEFVYDTQETAYQLILSFRDPYRLIRSRDTISIPQNPLRCKTKKGENAVFMVETTQFAEIMNLIKGPLKARGSARLSTDTRNEGFRVSLMYQIAPATAISSSSSSTKANTVAASPNKGQEIKGHETQFTRLNLPTPLLWYGSSSLPPKNSNEENTADISKDNDSEACDWSVDLASLQSSWYILGYLSLKPPPIEAYDGLS
jgi:hypothetical protein